MLISLVLPLIIISVPHQCKQHSRNERLVELVPHECQTALKTPCPMHNQRASPKRGTFMQTPKIAFSCFRRLRETIGNGWGKLLCRRRALGALSAAAATCAKIVECGTRERGTGKKGGRLDSHASFFPPAGLRKPLFRLSSKISSPLPHPPVLTSLE